MTTLVPLDPFSHAGPGFNHAAATEVFDTIMKMDADGGHCYATEVAGALLQHDQVRYAGEIAKALHEHLERTGPAARDALVRSYVAKRANGEDVSCVLAAAGELAEISKADPFTGPQYSPTARSQRAHEQQRELATGRFKRVTIPIRPNVNEAGRRLRPAPKEMAAQFGVPHVKGLSPEQLGDYQQAYRQVAGLVSGFAEHVPDDVTQAPRAFLHLHYANKTRDEIQPLPKPEALQLDAKRQLLSAGVSVLPANAEDDIRPYSAYENLRRAGQAGAANWGDTGAGVGRLGAYQATVAGADPFLPGSGLFARMNAGSVLLDQSFRTGDNQQSVLPKKLQTALKAGELVGVYGPEAQKIVQPVADKGAYRYRGTTRATPDSRLTRAVEQIRNDPKLAPGSRRDVLVRGTDTGDVRQPWKPSKVHTYFRSLLPAADLNTLQLKAGTVPPSQGVIINNKGQVVSQSVGYGDDHYLPFNLNKLRPLKGGEYIRTRTWGGPTTEDIYAGLVHGAKSITVVSHNGVYNLELDPSFTGSRRYNDKAARMVSRYGHLLDAVQSAQVTTGGIHPARLEEIKAEAESVADPIDEHDAYTTEVTRRIASEERNPILSGQQRAEAARDFLDKVAAATTTRDGSTMTRDELVDQWVNQQALARAKSYHERQADQAGADFRIRSAGRPLGLYGQGVDPEMTLGDLRRQVAEQAGLDEADPDSLAENAVTALGLGNEYQRHLERTEKDYKASLRPLVLNGVGYQKALTALQEQFPYYIARAEFRPWHDARNATDTGYVKPKHNRPAEALAGYFDSSINGQGKVTADSIRGQGRGQANKPYQTRAEKLTAARSAEREARGSVPGGTRRPTSPAVARDLRNDADLDYWRELKRHTHFSNRLDTEHPALNQEARGKPVADYLRELDSVNHPLFVLRNATEAEIKARQATPAGADALHAELAEVHRAVDGKKIFDLDEKAVAAFTAEGKAPEAVAFDRDDIGTMLARIEADEDFAFGHAALRPGSALSTAQLKAAWSSVAGPRHAALGLPDNLEAPDFAEKVTAATRALRDRYRAVKDYERRPTGGPQSPDIRNPRSALAPDVEALAQARQARRRYGEAQLRERPAETPGTPGAQRFEFTFAGPNGEPLGFQAGTSQAQGGAQARLRREPAHDRGPWTDEELDAYNEGVQRL